MRTRIHFVARRIPVALEGIGNDVTMVWNVYSGGNDQVFGAPAQAVSKTRVIPALLYFVSATTQLRQFAEVQAGDCIMDISPEITLDGLNDLRFVIDGQEWSSKPISESLARYWAVMQGNRKLWNTIILRRCG